MQLHMLKQQKREVQLKATGKEKKRRVESSVSVYAHLRFEYNGVKYSNE